jgi:hypothetical protein
MNYQTELRKKVGFYIDKFKSGKSFSKDLIENKMKYVFVDESWERLFVLAKNDKKKVKKKIDLLKIFQEILLKE